ncbi:hypothetical protein M430DRAFT_21054 [Amorphotheca resinae ATCC 22711]|uniref:Uncharacterized protein n=1 Tax=Amorphotheca resinae ATCC 22711 TaxID=857342 RepID=A0A2T3AWU3_AMORE|nr:hypothetical protein M430DRAFT_21054 [Amorphotheca resinae ATCC 22711]PSS13145.1 hypothetical protein M430DRAFT_21054 [Amorphotheca resinae ATCC 22711]
MSSVGNSKPSLAIKPPKTKFFDLSNLGLVLVLWDLLLGLPISYVLTLANKRIIQYLGYEKIMRCPSGILFSRCLFVTLNTVLLLAWAVQLAQEDEENVRIEREIQWWDREIERLEGLLERRKKEKKNRAKKIQRKDSGSGLEDASVIISDGKEWRESFARKVASSRERDRRVYPKVEA